KVNDKNMEVEFNLDIFEKDESNWEAGAGWTLNWSDEFDDGVFDTDTWTRQVMYDPFNNELQQYLDNSSVAYEENGNMVIKADHIEGRPYNQPDSYTSARVISNPGGQSGNSGATGKTFKYGKIAARIKLPGGKGIWPAFWMLGDNISETGGDTGWPQCGEIDILETGSVYDPNYGQGTVHGTVHRDPGTESNPLGYNEYISAGSYTLPNGEYFKEDFHVFEIEWDENQIIWKLDGVQFGNKDISSDVENEFHKPFYVLFNIAVGGHFTDTPDETTGFPQYMYIDWIRHYVK
ncbi:MAG: glycoside hydrolase family 16 protein, partial [Fusobacteriota bacterium]